MKLNILSPDSKGISVEATKVFFPGMDGSFEVLENHAAMVAGLGEGDIRWEGTGEGALHISSGFIQVKDNVITAAVEK